MEGRRLCPVVLASKLLRITVPEQLEPTLLIQVERKRLWLIAGVDQRRRGLPRQRWREHHPRRAVRAFAAWQIRRPPRAKCKAAHAWRWRDKQRRPALG